MSTAYYTEQVREVIYHLTSVIDGKFSLGRYNEIFRTSINIVSSLGKPFENNATNYNLTSLMYNLIQQVVQPHFSTFCKFELEYNYTIQLVVRGCISTTTLLEIEH